MVTVSTQSGRRPRKETEMRKFNPLAWIMLAMAIMLFAMPAQAGPSYPVTVTEATRVVLGSTASAKGLRNFTLKAISGDVKWSLWTYSGTTWTRVEPDISSASATADTCWTVNEGDVDMKFSSKYVIYGVMLTPVLTTATVRLDAE